MHTAYGLATFQKFIIHIVVTKTNSLFCHLVDKIYIFHPSTVRIVVTDIRHRPCDSGFLARHQHILSESHILDFEVRTWLSLYDITAVICPREDVVTLTVCKDDIRQCYRICCLRVKSRRHLYWECQQLPAIACQRLVAHVYNHHRVIVATQGAHRYRMTVHVSAHIQCDTA